MTDSAVPETKVIGTGAPGSLLPQHRVHLRESGLTDATIRAARICSVTDAALAGRLLSWESCGPVPAIGFPHIDANGHEYLWVLRPDVPVRRKEGSAPKYESPLGSGPRLYFPPAELVPTDAWGDLGAPVVVVEGIKKALAAVQAGMVAISAQGVTVWHDIEHKRRTGVWRLHGDFGSVELRGRRVFIAFDGGDTEFNPSVIKAEARLALLLCKAGAEVGLLRVPAPDGTKVGLDDYLVAQDDPAGALRRLVEAALPGSILERISTLEAADDPGRAGLALLDDQSAVAALDVADDALRDVARAELRRLSKISKTAVVQRINQFHRTFGANCSSVEDEDAVEPEILAEAEALLEGPDLVARLMAHVEAEGLVGERDAALLVLLASVSRLLSAPISLVVKAASSSGKNFVVRSVVRCFPPGDVIEVTDMSSRALQYLQESLKRKIVVIAEAEGAERAEYTLRSAMSEGRISVLVAEKNAVTGQIETRKHEVEGPACFITTTTQSKLHDENETRLLEIGLDESSEQTGRIVRAQARAAASPPSRAELEKLERQRRVWQVALGLLEPRRVRIPQAELLGQSFPVDQVRRRRDFPKLLALASAHALLHQRQRQVEGDVLLVDDVDIRVAKGACESLSSDIAPRLAKLHQRLLDEFGSTEFSPRDAAKALGQDTDALRRRLAELLDAELVEITTQHRGNKPAKWKLIAEPDCPSSSDSQAGRTEALDTSEGMGEPDCADPSKDTRGGESGNRSLLFGARRVAVVQSDTAVPGEKHVHLSDSNR